MTNYTTLLGTLVAPKDNGKNLLLVLGATVVIALAAQVSVPMFPVPMTLQTLVITMIGLTFGSRMAAATVLLYLAEGAVGLPVFANGGSGLVKLMGPTAGFLWGFVGMAFLTGWMVERGFSRGVFRLFLAAVIPAVLLYVPGILGLYTTTPLGLTAAVKVGALPFLIGDVVKSAIAAFVMTAGWAALRKTRK